MKQVAYFGRKNHYGLRLYKNRKNKIDCVSGYLSRYINIDKIERRGSSANFYVTDLKGDIVEQKEKVFKEKNVTEGINYLRWEATYAYEKELRVKTSEPILKLDKVSIFATYEYGVYDHRTRQDSYVKLESTVNERPQELVLGFTELKPYFDNSSPELNIKFSETKEIVDGEIPFRGDYVNKNIKNEFKVDGRMTSAFICTINYKVLIRSLFADGQYTRDDSQPIGYYTDEYIEQCRAKYFYFVLEGTSIKREKTTFRFILDANGELVEPSDDFVPHYEKKLRDNPLLTAGAVYHSPEGDIPLYKWVAKNLLTKYKNTRLALEFEKALTPLYLSRDFDSDKRLDRPIRNGDYISIADVFNNWMGGTLDESFDKTALGKIADKYLAKKKAELNITSKMASEEETAIKNEFLKHPLIYRVMNTNTKVKNDVGFQKCECLEVVDLNEIENIFI